MNFTFTDDEIAFQDAARRVSADVLKNNAKHYDETREFCTESLNALGELGFWGMNLPSDYDGVDISSIGMSLADGVDFELDLFLEVFETDDARVGVESFFEHGPGKARFTGS